MRYGAVIWCAWMGLSLICAVVGVIVMGVTDLNSATIAAVGAFGLLIGAVVIALFLLSMLACDMWENL